MILTPEAILALAPDSGSAANGKKLATPSKWASLHTAPGLLWGEAQGSGKDPYLVGVDTGDYVAKCSCPSRKFPCKHALALMLLCAQQADQFSEKEAPESLRKWLEGRGARAEAREQKAGEAARKEADPAAQAKRRAAREKKVTDGLAALQLFLKDLMRDGLAQASQRPYSDWDTQAARLVDAQAGGAARLVRQIPGLLSDPAALLTHLGKLHLLCQAWTRRERLSEQEQADLRTAIGFPLSQAEVLEQPGLGGDWLVAAQLTEQEDTLTTRRTWLLNGERRALLLDFAPLGRPLPPGPPLGQTVQAEVCYAPSAMPQRAVLRGEWTVVSSGGDGLEGFETLDELLAEHARLLTLNPWLERSGPYILLGMRLVPTPDGWRLLDREGQTLPMTSERAMSLLAESGGHPLPMLLGEWDGETFNVSVGVTGEAEAKEGA